MSHFDNKEHYLYGTLLALLEDQLEAIGKLTRKQLSLWGKYRIQPRGREIGNFVQKIQNHKINKGVRDINESIIKDLQLISEGYFPKVYSEEFISECKQYIMNLL